MVLPLLVSTQFQILFHSPSGVLFTFPSRYFVHYRSLRCLALGDGPPGFPQDFTCPVVLEDNREESDFHLQDCHLLWLAFPRHSINQNLCNFSLALQCQNCCLTTPLILSLQTACINGLGCSLFARRYWIGAIPAMVFHAIFMMPFYYGSKARSVPEYLKLRFDEKTRGLNAILFAVMTVLASGISMYALALLMEKVLVWYLS